MTKTTGLVFITLLFAGCLINPEPAVVMLTPSGWINHSDVTVTFKACDVSDPQLDCILEVTDALGNVSYMSLDNVECKPTDINLTLEDGVNTLTLSCTDDAGHTGLAEPLNLWIDTQSPTVEWLNFPG